jgi:signal recognition particle subunit SRP54
MLDKLGSAIKKGIDKISKAIFVDKKVIDEVVKELQRALIESDVNIKLVKEISDDIRKAAENEKIKGVEKREHIIKILHDRLTDILGKEKTEFKFKKGKKYKIMLLGLYGSGKTTTTSKLSNYFNKRGFNTCVLGLDVHRPAAREQLEQLGKQNKLKIFVDKKEKDPVKTYKKFKKDLDKHDIVFIDTAGRHSLDKELVAEIKKLKKEIKPEYVILVIPADIGQAAKNQASEFQKACNINGVIITRMDSTARGGGALTACNETKANVFFITTGEKVNDIEEFSPSNFVSRILGMGDLETLIEKVKSVTEETSLKKIKEGKFTMNEMKEQLGAMGKLGSVSKIVDMIPGLGGLLGGEKPKIPKEMIEQQGEKTKKWAYIIDSMTPEEKENPELIEKQTTRIQRIAKGAGATATEVRSLLKQFKIMKDFIKSQSKGLTEKDMMKFAKKFSKKMKFKRR